MDPVTDNPSGKRQLLVAEFARSDAAEKALGALNHKGFPLDQVSMMSRPAVGDIAADEAL